MDLKQQQQQQPLTSTNSLETINKPAKFEILKPVFSLSFSYHHVKGFPSKFIVQELCESRGGRPGLSVLTSLLASVDVKIY